MNDFLKRLSSRKFLTAIAVQVASVAALFAPESADEFNNAAVKIAALLVLLLAGLGYGKIESALDQSATDESSDSSETTETSETSQTSEQTAETQKEG